VDALTKEIRDRGRDLVIAIGGGSPMDCAKAASYLATTQEPSIRPFHTEGRPVGSTRLPLIVVPTTGTGSEVTPFAVLTDEEKEIKKTLSADVFYPTLALVDPLLTHSMPKALTAATGFDALTHAIEGYWSRNHQPTCDLYAREAARLVFEHLGVVLRNPADAASRRAMSYASTLAGMAFQLPKNAMVHACSYPLTRRHGIPHGVACAFVLEAAIRLNAPFMQGRMEAFSAYCGFADLDAMTARIRALKRLGGLPCTLDEARVPRSDVEAIIAESFDPKMSNNPKPIGRGDLRELYAGL
jgi:alcohol dehydrogenase